MHLTYYDVQESVPKKLYCKTEAQRKYSCPQLYECDSEQKYRDKGDSEIITMHLLYCKTKAQRIYSCTSKLAIRQ